MMRPYNVIIGRDEEASCTRTSKSARQEGHRHISTTFTHWPKKRGIGKSKSFNSRSIYMRTYADICAFEYSRNTHGYEKKVYI